MRTHCLLIPLLPALSFPLLWSSASVTTNLIREDRRLVSTFSKVTKIINCISNEISVMDSHQHKKQILFTSSDISNWLSLDNKWPWVLNSYCHECYRPNTEGASIEISPQLLFPFQKDPLQHLERCSKHGTDTDYRGPSSTGRILLNAFCLPGVCLVWCHGKKLLITVA